MKKVISILLLLSLILSFAACAKSEDETRRDTEKPVVSAPEATEDFVTKTVTPTGYIVPEDFSFSLVYGVCGDLTYDSETGVLVKQRVATHVEDYTTTYFFTAEQKEKIYELFVEMDPASYPDEYNPIDERIMSSPSYEVVLTVTYHGVTKTITCHELAFSSPAKDEQGEKFLNVLSAITEVLYASDEWQALPEYEFYYA